MNDVQRKPLATVNDVVASHTVCAIAPDRGDVTTVRAAGTVKIQQKTRMENMQSHDLSQRTVGMVEPNNK